MTEAFEQNCPANIDPAGASALLCINCVALQNDLLSYNRFLENIIHIAHHQYQQGTEKELVEELEAPNSISQMNLHLACLRLVCAHLIKGHLRDLFFELPEPARNETKRPPLTFKDLPHIDVSDVLGIEGNVKITQDAEGITIYGSMGPNEPPSDAVH